MVGLGGRSNGGGLRSNRHVRGGRNTVAFARCGGVSRSASGPASSPRASRASRNRGAFSSFSSSNPTPRSSRAVLLSALRCDTGSPRTSHASFDDKYPETRRLAPSLVLGLFSLRLWSAPRPAMRSAALADDGRRTTLITPRGCDGARCRPRCFARFRRHAPTRSASSRRPQAVRDVRSGVASEKILRFGWVPSSCSPLENLAVGA